MARCALQLKRGTTSMRRSLYLCTLISLLLAGCETKVDPAAWRRDVNRYALLAQHKALAFGRVGDGGGRVSFGFAGSTPEAAIERALAGCQKQVEAVAEHEDCFIVYVDDQQVADMSPYVWDANPMTGTMQTLALMSSAANVGAALAKKPLSSPPTSYPVVPSPSPSSVSPASLGSGAPAQTRPVSQPLSITQTKTDGGRSCGANNQAPPSQKAAYRAFKHQECTCAGGMLQENFYVDEFSCVKQGATLFDCAWDKAGGYYQCGVQ